MRKKSHSPERIVNRRARYDYELGDSLVVGLELTGAEAKALRMGHGQLRGAYVTEREGELWLINAQITGSAGISISEDAQTRSRKILAKRKEINGLIGERGQGGTIVPLELLTKGRYIKLRIAPGRGKKRYDKRESIKRRQQEREAKRVSR
ncbi:MAG TPA: SsrA-binding protein SmpB [Candidatus Saccharimonadales bacterium]|nr:SsrA-binding protein SmpB [Candidatus Saccharimonadales bacterium]